MIKTGYVNNNCRIDVLDGRIGYVSPALGLLLVFCLLRDRKTNTLAMFRSEMISALSDGRKSPSDRTIKGYISVLCKNGAIKYRYEKKGQEGRIFINPQFCYEGSETDYAKTLRRWENAGSDIEFIKA